MNELNKVILRTVDHAGTLRACTVRKGKSLYGKTIVAFFIKTTEFPSTIKIDTRAYKFV